MSQTVTLQFNFKEDAGINFTGTVQFANDFNIGNRTDLTIRGLSEWRNVDENVIHVNKDMLEDVVTPSRLAKFKNSGLKVYARDANSDIFLSYKIREQGKAAVKAQLIKFFKTLSNATVVEIIEQE
jgi:hypothetical protein